MDKIDDETKKFLEENFKAGEYAQLTMLVRLDDLQKLKELLESADIKSVMFGNVAENLEFYGDNTSEGKVLN